MDSLILLIIFGVVGICLIGYPFALIVTVFQLPTYVIIAFFIWIMISLAYIGVNCKTKVSEYIWLIILFDIIFTAILTSAGGGDIVGEDNKMALWYAPTISIPAICFIGVMISKVRIKNKKEKMRIFSNAINYHYRQRVSGIEKIKNMIDDNYKEGKTVERLLDLINSCGSSVLWQEYRKHSKRKDDDILKQIKEYNNKYHIELELENKTIGMLYNEANTLKEEYQEIAENFNKTNFLVEDYSKYAYRYKQIKKIK